MIQPSSLLTQAEANTSNKESEAKEPRAPTMSQTWHSHSVGYWAATCEFRHLAIQGIQVALRMSCKHDSLSCVGHLATTAHFIQFLLLRPRHSRNINVFMLIIWWNLQFQSHAPSRSTISQNQLATSEIGQLQLVSLLVFLSLDGFCLPIRKTFER